MSNLKPITAYHRPLDKEELYMDAKVSIDLGRYGSLSLNTLEGEPGETESLYAYIHGGVKISRGAFTCPWDSGEAGVITYHKDASEAEKDAIVDMISAYFENDNFYVLTDDDDDFEGRQSEVDDWAGENGYEVEYVF